MNELMEKLVEGKDKFELIGSMSVILLDFAFCYLLELVVWVLTLPLQIQLLFMTGKKL